MDDTLDVVHINTAMILTGELGLPVINGVQVAPEQVKFYLCLTNKQREYYYIPMTLASLRKSWMQYTNMRDPGVRLDRPQACLNLPRDNDSVLNLLIESADGLLLQGGVDNLYSITLVDDINCSSDGKVDLWRCAELAGVR